MHGRRRPPQAKLPGGRNLQAVHRAAVGKHPHGAPRKVGKPGKHALGRAEIVERAVQEVRFGQILGVEKAVQTLHAQPAFPPRQKPDLIVRRAGHDGHVDKTPVRVMPVPAHDFLFRHVGQAGEHSVSEHAPDHRIRLLLVGPGRDAGIAQQVAGKQGDVLPEVLVRAVVVGVAAHGLAPALEVEHAPSHGKGGNGVIPAVGGLHLETGVGGREGHALAGGKRPLTALGTEGEGLPVGLEPDDPVGLRGRQGDFDGVVVLGRGGCGQIFKLSGTGKPDGHGPPRRGRPAEPLLVEKDLRGPVARFRKGIPVLGRGVLGIRADVLVVKGAIRAGPADVAEHAVFFLVYPVVGRAGHGRPGDADDVAHGIERLGGDAGFRACVGFLPGLLVHGGDGVGVLLGGIVPVVVLFHNPKADAAGRGHGGHEGRLAPAPVVVGMARKPGRRMAGVREIDHVRRLGKAEAGQICRGIGRGERPRNPLLVRHHPPVRKPDAHDPVAKFQHPALSGGKDKGNEPAPFPQSHAEKARAGPARRPALRHGHKVSHFAAARGVAGLIHPPAHERGDLPAVEHVLNMMQRHQHTILAARKAERKARSGASARSFSVLARSSARSKSSR